MNRFNLYEEIHRGKHSQVYKGREKLTINYFAIRSVDKARRSRVSNEVEVLRTLGDCPRVVRFDSFHETKNHLWVVMEYCPGGDLGKIMKADGWPFPPEKAAEIVKGILSGVSAIHSRGFLHLDLQPSVILFGHDGNVKVTGFSNACSIDSVAAARQAKAAFPRRGTPHYMAPELVIGSEYPCEASDVWPIGIMLHEMMEGKPPFYGLQTLNELVSAMNRYDANEFFGRKLKDLQSKAESAPTPAGVAISVDSAIYEVYKLMVFELLAKTPEQRGPCKTLIEQIDRLLGALALAPSSTSSRADLPKTENSGPTRQQAQQVQSHLQPQPQSQMQSQSQTHQQHPSTQRKQSPVVPALNLAQTRNQVQTGSAGAVTAGNSPPAIGRSGTSYTSSAASAPPSVASMSPGRHRRDSATTQVMPLVSGASSQGPAQLGATGFRPSLANPSLAAANSANPNSANPTGTGFAPGSGMSRWSTAGNSSAHKVIPKDSSSAQNQAYQYQGSGYSSQGSTYSPQIPAPNSNGSRPSFGLAHAQPNYSAQTQGHAPRVVGRTTNGDRLLRDG